MMYTIARDPDIAIFVEMMSNIQKSLLKFGLGFVWLFVGTSFDSTVFFPFLMRFIRVFSIFGARARFFYF